ncbi:MFS transporter [Saccharomonospora iraqiensis]|uniref:MFS transporter n=1 Tax=Saccharomonospora iraqiensis TaxID=52698 RepID=UPI00041FFF0E|nr:MFS transporter [Saccharomonospora iraqiensis]
MHTHTIDDSPPESPDAGKHTRWNARLLSQLAALIVVNALADTVILAPTQVLPQMLEHFGTDQAAWLTSSAMLAGAMWAPLIGKCADIYGKRRMLVISLLIACVGSLVCLAAPSIWVFVLGRLMQGAAVAAMFLSMAIVRDLCTLRIAMPIVGLVGTGAGILGMATPFLYEMLAAEFGYPVVFVAAALIAVLAVIGVRALIPRSTNRTPGTVDVAGAVLLGGGLAAVLSYISLGPGFGWLSGGPLMVLGGGAAALARWFLVSSRKPEPVIDIRNLNLPLILNLLVLVLGAGAVRAIDPIVSIIAHASPDEQLGYGLAGPTGTVGLLFALPGVGMMIAGPLAGWIATRVGPPVTLAAGATLGTVGTTGMFLGATNLYAALFFSFLMALSTGALMTSGFSMVAIHAREEQQAVMSSLVMVMMAISSVVMTFVVSAVLSATDTVIAGENVQSATGVLASIGVLAGFSVLAAVAAGVLVRRLGITSAHHVQ